MYISLMVRPIALKVGDQVFTVDFGQLAFCHDHIYCDFRPVLRTAQGNVSFNLTAYTYAC